MHLANDNPELIAMVTASQKGRLLLRGQSHHSRYQVVIKTTLSSLQNILLSMLMSY